MSYKKVYLKLNCNFKVCCEASTGFQNVERENILDIDNSANIWDRGNGENSFEFLF